MKIIIQHDQGEWPVDTDKPSVQSLEELMDTFTQPQVRLIINETLRVFREMCDEWNRRELERRRHLEQAEGAEG